MTGLATMPPRNREKTGDEEKYTAAVKLKPTFQSRLAAVAEDLKMHQGELIEVHLGKFIRQEFTRVMKKRREQADKELRDLERD